jgi:hypothetical protein
MRALKFAIHASLPSRGERRHPPLRGVPDAPSPGETLPGAAGTAGGVCPPTWAPARSALASGPAGERPACENKNSSRDAPGCQNNVRSNLQRSNLQRWGRKRGVGVLETERQMETPAHGRGGRGGAAHRLALTRRVCGRPDAPADVRASSGRRGAATRVRRRGRPVRGERSQLGRSAGRL